MIKDNRGLYNKYRVAKADGSPCEDYKFVLSPEKSEADRKALQAFADATSNMKLRDDIYMYLEHLNHRWGLVSKAEKLEEVIKEGKIHEDSYFAVMIEMKGLNAPEISINPMTNAENRLSHYANNYDVNLNHRYIEGVRIVGCGTGGTTEESISNITIFN